MKKLFLAAFASFLFTHVGFSNASEPLDGSVILITSEDPVKVTLVFENGLIVG